MKERTYIEVILCIRGVCREGLRSTDDKSCSGRYIPYCEDNLSCSVSLFESIWDSGESKTF